MPHHEVSQDSVLLFFRNVQFDLDKFINQVCVRFETARDQESTIVLIEWIE